MRDREYNYVTPISNNEEQYQENGFRVVEIQEVFE